MSAKEAKHQLEIRIGQLEHRLGNARILDKGEIAQDKDVVALAHFLLHTMLGLSVASRAFGRREDLRQSAQLALQALG